MEIEYRFPSKIGNCFTSKSKSDKNNNIILFYHFHYENVCFFKFFMLFHNIQITNKVNTLCVIRYVDYLCIGL